MDQQLIGQKLEALRRCLLRVKEKCPQDVAVLRKDQDIQDIVVLNLTRAVQLCVDIAAHLVAESDKVMPTTMGETFEILKQLNIIDAHTAKSLRKAVGFRNVAVHNYDEINWDIVYAICKQHLPDFKAFAKQVIVYTDL